MCLGIHIRIEPDRDGCDFIQVTSNLLDERKFGCRLDVEAANASGERQFNLRC